MKILITGTTSGIGNYIALNLKNNHEIVGVGRSENNIEGIDFFRGNLKDELFLEKILKEINEIDFLIVNAGIGTFDKFENINNLKHRDIIETNLLSPILFSNLFLKDQKIKKGIIFIGSIAGKKSMKNGASYSASKFGLRGFAMQLKNEYTKLKIHLINPSIVKTNFHKDNKIEIVGKYRENSLDEVFEVIKNIIDGKENRFEIDL